LGIKKERIKSFFLIVGPCFFPEKWFAVGVDIFYNEASKRRRACDA
jgi:hypothetical protein